MFVPMGPRQGQGPRREAGAAKVSAKVEAAIQKHLAAGVGILKTARTVGRSRMHSDVATAQTSPHRNGQPGIHCPETRTADI